MFSSEILKSLTVSAVKKGFVDFFGGESLGVGAGLLGAAGFGASWRRGSKEMLQHNIVEDKLKK